MNSGPKRHNSAIGGDEKQWQCEEISRSRRKWVWNKWVRKGWQGSSVPRSNRITTAGGQRSNTGLKETMDGTKNTQDTMTTHCLQCYWKQKRQSLGAGSHNKLALQVTCAHMCLHIITLLWRVRYWEKFTMVFLGYLMAALVAQQARHASLLSNFKPWPQFSLEPKGCQNKSTHDSMVSKVWKKIKITGHVNDSLVE